MLENESLEETQEGEGLSLREELQKAMTEAKEPADPQPLEKPAPARDETGKFASKPETEAPAVETTAAEAPKPKDAPNSWKAETKAKWQELPDWAKDEILRRESDTQKLAGTVDEERGFGKALKDVITPYMPIITAEGGNPVAAVQDLLNTAYKLRTGSPQEKRQLLDAIEAQYKVPPKEITDSDEFIDPIVKALQEQVSQLQGQLTQFTGYTKQQQDQAIQSEIQAFASDPKNVHFDALSDQMVLLINASKAQGRKLSLQEAYDTAAWAHPEIRSTLLTQHTQQSEAQRIAEQKAKAESAKRAGVSVKGSPGAAIPNVGASDNTLREDLRAAYRAAQGQI